MPATVDPLSHDAAAPSTATPQAPWVGGTPYGRWPALADALPEPLRYALQSAAEPPGPLASGGTDRPALMFVDGPAHAVARWLERHPDGDPANALQEWCDAAQRILRRAHGHPTSCMLVDTEEAAREPAALQALLGSRFGLVAARALEAIALEPVDPVAIALAAGLTRNARLASSLNAQLQASCMPLTAEEDATLAVEAVDFGAAVNAWRQSMRGGRAERESLGQQLARAREALASTRCEADDLLLNLHQTQEELEALLLERQTPHPAEILAKRQAADLATLRQMLEAEGLERSTQAAALQQALDAAAVLRGQAQAAESLTRRQTDDLDALRIASQRLAAELDERAAKSEQSRLELAELQSRWEALLESTRGQDEEIARLRTAGAALQQVVDDHGTRVAALQSLSDRQNSELGQTRRERDEARREADLLQLQLHTVQEELAHHFCALKALEASPLPAGVGQAVPSVHDLIVVGSSHASPHHHLQVDLLQLRTPYLALERLTVRLAEHEGRPGLVFLAPDDAPTPLVVWQPTGEESGRPLMTVVPADPASWPVLDRMATGDWQLLTGLVALLHHRLSDPGLHPEARHWRTVAARLQRQFAQLPPRLRYGTVELSLAADDAGQGALDLRFGQVVFGLEARADLHLRWRPEASHGAAPTQAPLLLLGAVGDDEPPLAGWPVDADGHADASVVLPVGPGMGAVEKRRRWAAFSDGDRALVLALLDALPACAGQAGQVGRDPSALDGAARSLFRDAMKSRRQALWRRAVRTLLRRARGR